MIFFTMEHHGFCDDEFYFEEIPFGLWRGLIDGRCVLPKLLSGGVLFSEQASRLLLGGAMSRHILTI
jgi:hypothetical protein